ncbi:unnamed protein product [Camellia sinensis]
MTLFNVTILTRSFKVESNEFYMHIIVIFNGGYSGNRNIIMTDHIYLFFSERSGRERLPLRQITVAKVKPRIELLL